MWEKEKEEEGGRGEGSADERALEKKSGSSIFLKGRKKERKLSGKRIGELKHPRPLFLLQCQLRCEAADENGMVSWDHVWTRDEKPWWYFQPLFSFRGDPKKVSLRTHSGGAMTGRVRSLDEALSSPFLFLLFPLVPPRKP